MVGLCQDPEGTNVFGDTTSSDNGAANVVKQAKEVSLTGFRTNTDKPPDAEESVYVLRARVSHLEKQLAEVM